MNDHFKEIILKATGSNDLFEIKKIQDLWGGYGCIIRYGLKGSALSTVVVKHVRLPKGDQRSRGGKVDLSHDRKVKSYEVETEWYHQWSQKCDKTCYVPDCFATEFLDDEVLMVLEDLNSSGYEGRRTSVSMNEIRVCLKWLANFHATFMGEKPKGLWNIGTYWHLDTRPDELDILDDMALKNAARAIDQKLNDSPFQTFVHGDVKLANFCFSKDGRKVAAVDFQYVGGGCGMKDVAYFIGSCLHEEDCERFENELLNYYFQELKQALLTREKDINFEALEKDWRELYPIAWTDFHRFMKGWSLGYWKKNSYSERIARQVLEKL